MRTERLRAELELVRDLHGDFKADDRLTWMLLPSWPLPAGWNVAATALAIILPPAYPTTPPDNFYVASTLRLASGAMPGNTSLASAVSGLPPGDWLRFSWHIEANWMPAPEPVAGDNLLTFLASVTQRLAEVG